VERGNLGRKNDRANGAVVADPGRVTIKMIDVSFQSNWKGKENFEKRLPVTQQSEGGFGTPNSEDRV
jgi:hypothetical protein